MNWTTRTIVLVVGISLSALTNTVTAEDKFPGDVTVAGTLKARDIRVANDVVATEKALGKLHKEILAEVVSEISNKLKFSSNSPEMLAFADQITKSVVKTIGTSAKAVEDLRRELDTSTKSAASQVTELKRTITVLQSEQKTAERELATLKREIAEIRRELSKKR